eukprot:7321165-Pyramimonas_sp.AAC.1
MPPARVRAQLLSSESRVPRWRVPQDIAYVRRALPRKTMPSSSPRCDHQQLKKPRDPAVCGRLRHRACAGAWQERD